MDSKHLFKMELPMIFNLELKYMVITKESFDLPKPIVNYSSML